MKSAGQIQLVVGQTELSSLVARQTSLREGKS